MSTDRGSTASPRQLAKPEGVLGPRYRWVSIGMCLLVTLAAFEALAVTTIMPAVSRELDGAALYAFAFAGPLAVGVVGMVLAGIWCNRGNPRTVLYASVVLFAVGLTVAGASTTMPLFVTGRLIHGLGGGALTVALYVIVARVYPARLHPSIFAGFAAAWVVPSLIGPVIAGAVAETVGWRWVFLGVVALVVLAMLMVVPAMRAVHGSGDRAAGPRGTGGRGDVVRAALAALVAAAVLGLTLAAEARGPVQWLVPVVAAAVAVAALRPLLPAGALLARRGLPSVILVRAIVAGAFFSAEVYVPLLMVTQYGASPAVAGLALTAAGLSWAAASWAQGRFPAIGYLLVARLGALGVTIAIASLLITALTGASPVVIVVGWAFAGLGMGLLYPRLGVLTLQYSTPADQGFNSSALSIADSTGSAIALAATAIAFSALGGASSPAAFAGVFAVDGLLCLAAWLCGPRILAR